MNKETLQAEGVAKKMFAYLYGIVPIESVIAEIQNFGPAFYQQKNLGHTLLSLKNTLTRQTMAPAPRVASNADYFVSPLAVLLLEFANGKLPIDNVTDFLQIKNNPEKYFLDKENLSALLHIYCDELIPSRVISAQQQPQKPQPATPAKQDWSQDVARITADMINCAKQYKKIQACLKNPNTPEGKEGCNLCEGLQQQLNNLPAEFYTAENVGAICDKYYDAVIQMNSIEPKPNETLQQFGLRSKAHEQELGCQGGFYDIADIVSMFLVGAAHEKNGFEPKLFGLSQESPIDMTNLFDGDGK